MLKFAAILGKMENGCDLAAKYLQFYSFQKGKTVNLSYGKKKVIEEIIRLVDAQDYTAVIHSERAELIDRSSFG